MSHKKMNCWEFKDCGRGPGGREIEKLGICPAACNLAYDGFNQGTNAGRLCWLVAGTFCGGTVQGKFAEKRLSCRGCDFYKLVQDEEGTTILKTDTLNIAAHTHIGNVRKSNEDRYLIKQLPDGYVMLAIADGLGGEVGSDFAAEITRARLAGLNHVADGRELETLSSLIVETDLAIRVIADNDIILEGMGTTLICLLIRNNSIWWAHVGDSRLYLLRADAPPLRITKDQTLARFLVEEGEILPVEARTHYSRFVMDQCVGCGICEPETGVLQLLDKDLLILSTDGFHKLVPDPRIAAVFSKRVSLEAKLDMAIHKALDAGGKDNITILAAEILKSESK